MSAAVLRQTIRALTTDVSVVAEQHSRVDGEQDLLAVAVCIEEKGHLIHLPLTKTISDYTPCRTKAQEPFWDRKNRKGAGSAPPGKKGGGKKGLSLFSWVV